MIRRTVMSHRQAIIDEGLNALASWAEIVEDLVAAGCCDEEIAALLRSHEAWASEAAVRKVHGLPYDEIVFHLVSLRATWGDVARALMMVGLPPADMLRAVLPCTENEEPWEAIKAALVDGSDEADYDEARGVISWYVSEQDAFASLDLDDSQRAKVERRLGLSA